MKQLFVVFISRKNPSKVGTKEENFLWFIAMLILISLASCQKETKSNDPTNDLIAAGKNEKSSLPQVTTKVFATGLINPRELKFGPDGNLYVAEGGTGGSTSTVGQCTQAAGLPAGPGPYLGSTTGGRISKIDANGIRTTVTDKLPSSQTSSEFGSLISGVADIEFIGNTFCMPCLQEQDVHMGLQEYQTALLK